MTYEFAYANHLRIIAAILNGERGTKKGDMRSDRRNYRTPGAVTLEMLGIFPFCLNKRKLTEHLFVRQSCIRRSINCNSTPAAHRVRAHRIPTVRRSRESVCGSRAYARAITIGRIIMIGSLFRRKPTYTNRLACLIVINNAKGAHKAVTSRRATAVGKGNCNLPIGNRETPMPP